MKIEKPINSNYCATVAKVDVINKLDNCDNVVAAIVCGSQVIVSKDTKVGDVGIFFPVETKLSSEFLSKNNLFRKKELNDDKEKAGYFEEKGRLRAVKFRGHKSEGIFLPLASLSYLEGTSALPHGEVWPIGTEFDHIGETEICKKYVVQRQRTPGQGGNNGPQGVNRESRVLTDQFRLHRDTAQLKKNIHAILPDSNISISMKMHGTSAVFGNVIVKRKLNWFENVLQKFGVQVKDKEYDSLYSSRKVVKNGLFPLPSDVRGEKVWDFWQDRIKSLIPKGVTLYGEIVGFQPNGGYVQKGYDYGHAPGTSGFYCYRITQTNVDGEVFEYTRSAIDEFCKKFAISTTPLFYLGKAKDVYPDIPIDENWGRNFLARLDADEKYHMADTDCTMCTGKIPAEGCVVRLESIYDATPYKLKNYRFLEGETKALDKGEVDIEEEN